MKDFRPGPDTILTWRSTTSGSKPLASTLRRAVRRQPGRRVKPANLRRRIEIPETRANWALRQILAQSHTFIRIAKKVGTVEFRPPVEVKSTLEAKD
jgi:hypothetical protein